MPDTFRVVATDPIVTQYNRGNLIALAQVSMNFVFEFHGGHETGNPVYVRVVGNKDNSNVPKFDTKNKTAANYTSYSKLANSGKLDQAKRDKDLKNTDLTEITNLIVNNFAFFQQLASDYYAK
jgi:hypothetical protein